MLRKIKLICLFTACYFVIMCSALYSQSRPEDNQLLINSSPEGASVFINDKFCGKTPYKEENVKSHNLKVKVTLNGFTREQSVASIMGVYEMFFLMDGDYGILDINTAPLSARVFVDDSLRGETPLSELKLDEGFHKLTVERESYDKIERRVYVYPMKYVYNFKLDKKFSTLSLKDPQQQLSQLKVDGSLLALEDDNYGYKIQKGNRSLDILPKGFKHSITESFDIEGGFHYELSATYNYFTPKYFLLSAVIPGLGQFLDKSEIKGSAYLIGTLLCTAVYLKAEDDHKLKFSDYLGYRENYNKADNEPDAIKYRALMETKVDELNKLSRIKGLFLSASIGIYLLNIADAVIFHSNGSDLELHKILDIDTQNNRLGLKIKLN